ncbi:MAG: hypothetical protein JWN53_1804, partial [Gemmatimonadetes bacterium]|nr:hypothetical protein [Gemmatimonadota bacterium]
MNRTFPTLVFLAALAAPASPVGAQAAARTVVGPPRGAVMVVGGGAQGP